MPGKKKKEELTPEEYRQKARKEMQDLKNQWKIFFKTGFIMLAALIAIIVACIAWFVSNNKVDSTGMNIRAAGSEFDLAAYIKNAESTNGIYDNLLSVPNGEKNKEYSVTSGSHTAISWAITDDSNLRNETDKSLGIEPGSSGSITFYIVPHKNGALNVSLTLSLTGYTLKNTGTELTSESLTDIKADAQQLLEGHILLFAGYDKQKNSYKGWISQDGDPWSMSLDNSSLSQKENGELIWSIQDAKAENAYPVTVYWIWPELLESYLLKKESYTGTRPLLFPGKENGSTSGSDLEDIPSNLENGSTSGSNLEDIPSNLFKKMCEVPAENSNTSVNSNRYLRWETKETFENTVTVDTLNQIRSRYNSALYGNVAAYYDLADQYIGSNVQYVKLTLNAR